MLNLSDYNHLCKDSAPVVYTRSHQRAAAQIERDAERAREKYLMARGKSAREPWRAYLQRCNELLILLDLARTVERSAQQGGARPSWETVKNAVREARAEIQTVLTPDPHLIAATTKKKIVRKLGH